MIPSPSRPGGGWHRTGEHKAVPYYSLCEQQLFTSAFPYLTTRLSSLTCFLIFSLFLCRIRGPLFYSLSPVRGENLQKQHSSMNLFVMPSLSSQCEATSITPFHSMLHVLLSVLHFSCYRFVFLVGCLFISVIGTFYSFPCFSRQ